MPKKYFSFLYLLGLISLISSCKKNDMVTNLNPSTPTVSATSILKDSAVSYTRDIYLWYQQIPASFNGKNYKDLDEVMTSVRQYSLEPGVNTPADRWSFAVKQSEWDNVSSGISGDFGISVFFRADGDLRVKSVEKSSPAGKAGIQRGWRITKINGNSNLSTANADFIVQAIWKSNNTVFTFQKHDGSISEISLLAATYHENPVIIDSVYSIQSKKIGYLSFQSFLGDTNEVYNDFSRIFNKFTSSGVSDVIIDLRYNGGGYVSVQQKLANWLAPQTANGLLMMKQQFNDKYTQYNDDAYFKKLGSLNLNRIFFIVSGNTASASELLINNLKPFMDVQLVGPGKTYGKPVGYFPIEVGDSYIFPVSFRTTNKNGDGNYFSGLPLNSQVSDGLDKDWGDIHESCFQQALSYISSGAYKAQTSGEAATIRTQQETATGNRILDRNTFKGMIDTRKLDRL